MELDEYLAALCGDSKKTKESLRAPINDTKERECRWENFTYCCYIICKFDSGNLDLFGIVRTILDKTTKKTSWKKVEELVEKLRRRDVEWKKKFSSKMSVVKRMQTLVQERRSVTPLSA